MQEAGDDMSDYEMVKDNLDGFHGQACLIKHKGGYFVVSSVVAYSGFETLVFKANKDGEVSSWCDVAGGRGMDRQNAINDLIYSKKV